MDKDRAGTPTSGKATSMATKSSKQEQPPDDASGELPTVRADPLVYSELSVKATGWGASIEVGLRRHAEGITMLCRSFVVLTLVIGFGGGAYVVGAPVWACLVTAAVGLCVASLIVRSPRKARSIRRRSRR
jgi:hypothetical protein